MNKRILLLMLVVLLVSLLSFTEFYHSEWVVNAKSDVVTISAGDAVFEPWNRIWIAPLTDGDSSLSQDGLTSAMQQELQARSLNGELAQRYVSQHDLPGPTPVALLVESDWDLNRTLTGWKVSGTLIAQTVGFGDEMSSKTVNYRASIAAAATYTGWVRRPTVEAQLMKQLAGKLADGLAHELRKQGQALPPEPSAQDGVVKQSSFQINWPWSKRTPQPNQGNVPADIDHPLIVDGAKVDYYWQISPKTAIVYRVEQSGVQLEQQLLSQVTGSVKNRDFQNAVHDRRHWSSWDLQMTHWAVDGDLTNEDGVPGRSYTSMQDEALWRRVLVVKK